VYQQAARSLEALVQEIKDRRVDESIHKQVQLFNALNTLKP